MAVLPRVQELDGFCSASLLISRETGRAAGTVTFERLEQLEASRDAAAVIREAASRDIGASIDDVAEMEVALAHLHCLRWRDGGGVRQGLPGKSALTPAPSRPREWWLCPDVRPPVSVGAG